MAIGIRFSEEMRGRLVDGDADPEQLTKEQLAAGIEVELQATVLIQDLDAFIANPKHQGVLSGRVVYSPLGDTQDAINGVFNLFAPGGNSEEKLMVYELAAIPVDGNEFYFAGYKMVRDDPGPDLWSDTTTLYTRLHQGTDKTGGVVATGVLTLVFSSLVELLKTIEVVGTTSTVEKIGAITRFGRFFSRELWDTYGLEVLAVFRD